MALRFHFSPLHSTRSLPPPRRFIHCLSQNNFVTNRSAILWFKHDLRLDDHPALSSAAKSHSSVLPLYVFDHRILSRYSDDVLELVLYALQDLRALLKEKGSNLMIRFGCAESVIREVALQVKAMNVFAEHEVEYHLREIMDSVEESLRGTAPVFDESPRVMLWQTPFYDIKDLKALPASYADFEKLQCKVTSPIQLPTLPGIQMDLEWGSLPTLDDLKKFMKENPIKVKGKWDLIKEEASIESILRRNLGKSKGTVANQLNYKKNQLRRLDSSVLPTEKQDVVGGGADTVLNGLAGYLRYLEGTARDDWQEVHDKLRTAETRDGASFFALFGPALFLGIISRRRVYHEAIKYEKERNGGFLSPLGYSTTTVAAAANAVCSMEWYWLMALKYQINDGASLSIRTWRWKGYLVQYKVVGDEGPPILLVHGFGAFLEHYRDNIHGIAEGGKRVWAITMLGFGKSEKPNIVYTELMWAELLRDFIIDVVGEPVHLVGNSLGGYVVAIVASFWRSLVKSVVLINSAGDVIPGYGYLQFTKDRQPSGPAWLGARFLSFYLRLNLRSIVKSCYPTEPERADDWLIEEMLRASYDPGVLIVLESIFSFNLSLPLNYLLEGFEENTLVIQGMKDPIVNSKTKVTMFKENCSRILVRELDAGHCPHDELPEEVNSIICEWTSAVEMKLLAEEICT